MFNTLKQMLLTVLTQFSETKYSRLLISAAVIIPLVITMYGYIDDVIFDSKNALNSISDYSISNGQKTFPLGAYTTAYMSVAKIPECLTIIFGYITTAIVWSFTTDLKPAFTRK